jgi:hypothetical protein
LEGEIGLIRNSRDDKEREVIRQTIQLTAGREGQEY